MPKQKLTGINVQYPISRLILDGRKTIETRTYPIPKKYVGKDMVLVETPGRHGSFKARIVAIIRFTESFKYESKTAFYKDVKHHCVTPDSEWAWKDNKPKWGWRIDHISKFSKPRTLNIQKGIVYTLEISI